MRTAHYLKKLNNGQAPSNCIFVDTETKATRIDKRSEQANLWFGWACYTRRKHTQKWTKPSWRKFYHAADFWIECDFLTRDKTKLYIYAHNQSFDFTVMRGWHYLTAMGWTCKIAIIESPPTLITWERGNRTIIIIDTLNYFRVALKQLGKDIGMYKLNMPNDNASQKRWDAYCRRDVKVIHKAMMSYFAFISDNDLGAVRVTLASQALSTYRYRFMKHDILIDSNNTALTLARESYKGGRTEAWFIGEIKSNTHLVDLNSMYPAIMQKDQMPRELISTYKNVSFAELSRWLEKYCVIADVDIITDEPCYAVRHDGKLIFPVGSFNITLSTPELIYALEHRHITKIRTVALYENDIIFEDYVKWMYFARRSFIECGNIAFAYMAKNLLTNLYGKFGQSGYQFTEIDNTDDMSIKSWLEVDGVSGDTYKYRQFGGLIQTYEREGESQESSPAVASHVTAHGRMQMWRLIKVAGLENVYYMDTDSLLVNDVGLANLHEHMHTTKIGMLKLEASYNDVEIFGAKDYRFGDKVKIKGIRKTAIKVGKNSYQQPTFVGFKGMLAAGNMDKMIIRDTVKNLTRRYTKGLVSSSGKVLPISLPLDQ